MAKSDRKLHEARMAGAAWLMNVIKTQGMEAAEKELKTRGAMFVPFEVNQKQLDESVYKIKLNTIDTILIMSCMAYVMSSILDRRGLIGSAKDLIQRQKLYVMGILYGMILYRL